MAIRIKNWAKFQHFKDRRPSWIKLYRDIIDDKEWFKLSGEAAKFLTFLWILASEDETMEGNLPDIETISWRYRVDIEEVNRLLGLARHFLIIPDMYQSDINAISERYQLDAPEKRRDREETETETETEEAGRIASKTTKRPAAKKTDDDLLEEIRNNPAYQGIDLEVEIGKMQAWCKVNNRLPTSRRLINWLNRIDRPLQAISNQQAGPKTFDQIKMDNIKQAMIDFVGEDYDGPGQKTICLDDGGNGRSIQSGHEQGNDGDILQAPD